MKKLIILLPLILILILITSCFPTSTPVETDEPEENIIVENGMILKRMKTSIRKKIF